jgi:hypothetical protein
MITFVLPLILEPAAELHLRPSAIVLLLRPSVVGRTHLASTLLHYLSLALQFGLLDQPAFFSVKRISKHRLRK